MNPIKIEVTDKPLTLVSGRLYGLTEDQVRRRSHCLKESGDGYEIKSQVQFKVGEVVLYAGDCLPKDYIKNPMQADPDMVSQSAAAKGMNINPVAGEGSSTPGSGSAKGKGGKKK